MIPAGKQQDDDVDVFWIFSLASWFLSLQVLVALLPVFQAFQPQTWKCLSY